MILASASTATVLLSAAAALAYAVPAAGASRLNLSGSRSALLAAWLLHGALLCWGLLFSATPRFGFAPALSVTAWLVLTVYAVESRVFPQLHARWALATFGAVAVLLAPAVPRHTTACQRLPVVAAALGAGHRLVRLVRGRRRARLADAPGRKRHAPCHPNRPPACPCSRWSG